MRRFFSRMTAVGALSIAFAGCSSGSGTSLPFAGGPNNAGGSQGTIQTGSNGQALLRFVNGAPDFAKVDVCVDSASPSGVAATNISYKGSSAVPFAITAGIAHTVAAYVTPAVDAGGPGAECATAPGPYFGSSALAVTTIALANNTRSSLVLGGRTGTTLGLYYFPSPASFVISPTSPEALVFDASPTFGNVGIGYVPAGGSPANIAGNLNAPVKSRTTETVTTAGSYAAGPLPGQPSSFFVGEPVSSGTVVPLTSEPASPLLTGSTYVASVYSVDSTNAAGVDLAVFTEPVTGYGF